MTGRHSVLASVAAAALLAGGCGYSVGPESLYAYRSVRVAVAGNESERRAHEFDLTQAMVREFEASGVRVNAGDATVRVVMTIVDIAQPALVAGKLDVVTVGSVDFKVRLEIEDIATGHVLNVEEHSESAAFALARGESTETARQQVLDRLARWAATKLEKDW